jgi:bacterioferritin
MTDKRLDTEAAVAELNKILEMELAGVVRYSHYALMMFGHSRIPIVSWLRDQAAESLGHAHEVGEVITYLGAHPSLAIGPLLETHRHDVDDILGEALAHEREALDHYRSLLGVVEGRSVYLEEFARKMIYEEERHQDEVNKMLRNPGEVAAFEAGAT